MQIECSSRVLVSGKGSDIRYCICDNSCWSSNGAPPDSLHELFQNRTKADKTLISVMAKNSVPMETDEGQ